MLKVAIITACAAAAIGYGLARLSPDGTPLLAAVRATLAPAAPIPVVTAPPPRPIFASASPPMSDLDTTVIEADRYGQFETEMQIAGRSLPALVDTGATFVALTYDAAASIGYHLSDAEFKYAMNTANGTARAASITIPLIRVGNVEARNVLAVVSQPGALTGRSLLGMSFLKKLGGFETGQSSLVLKQEH